MNDRNDRTPENRTRVAVANLPVDEGAVDANLARALDAVERATATGARLLVLPECALTGYRYDSRAEVEAAALALDDAPVVELAERAEGRELTVVVGLLERAGTSLYNSAAVLGADGRVTVVRKVHLPHLGADRFVAAGDAIGPVIDTACGRVGVAICYDFRFPETCRTLALGGAEIVAVPVNWSTRVAVLAEHGVPTRALENRVFVAVADRVGGAPGAEHLGASRVADPDGAVVAAPQDRSVASVTAATVDRARARDKSTVFVPGEFEIDAFVDRRPQLYGALTAATPMTATPRRPDQEDEP